jgi:hypothetical protein
VYDSGDVDIGQLAPGEHRSQTVWVAARAVSSRSTLATTVPECVPIQVIHCKLFLDKALRFVNDGLQFNALTGAPWRPYRSDPATFAKRVLSRPTGSLSE